MHIYLYKFLYFICTGHVLLLYTVLEGMHTIFHNYSFVGTRTFCRYIYPTTCTYKYLYIYIYIFEDV